MSDSTEERKEEIKLQLAEAIMKTIPSVPDDWHEKTAEEQDRIFRIIDERSEKVMALLGAAKKGRGPALNPRGPRRSERFNTPELDTGIAKRRAATPPESVRLGGPAEKDRIEPKVKKSKK